MIPRQIVDEIVYRNDIEQVIGSYVTLKRAGSNYNGLCPFHSERTPSFTVFPSTHSFYCFGCGAGGDAISFMMRIENLEYVDAVRVLAQRIGVDIPEEDEQNGGASSVTRKRVLQMNLEAAKFFRDQLMNETYGKEALHYLTVERGLSMATVRRFGLGYSPNNAWLLTNHLRSLGFTDDEMVTGFLCGRSQKTGRLYDYFRNRVIFPIIDTAGNVVAFGGRVMDDSKPKYLNTSDTPAFKKSRHLFALNYAKNNAAEQMLLCEGYMDVIALHAAGFENAVATLGTAITPEQARIFAKYTKKVVITYDSDSAGQTASDKAMRLLGEVGVDVRVLKLEGAKDPDEFIRKFGADAFRDMLRDSKSGFAYRVDKVLMGHDISVPEEKIKASSAICAIIAASSSAVEREVHIAYAAERLGLTPQVLAGDVSRIRSKMRREQKKKLSNDAQMQLKGLNDHVNRDAAKHIKASAAEEAVLGLMLVFEQLRHVAAEGLDGLSAEDFSTEFGRRVFQTLCELEKSDGGYSKALLAQFFTVDELGRLEQIEQTRRSYSKNDIEVLRVNIANLKEEKGRDTRDVMSILELKRQKANQMKQKKNEK